MRKLTYKNTGVDIKKAETFIKKAGLKSLKGLEAFGAVFNLDPLLKQYKNPFLISSTDGVGTKLKLAQMLNIHSTVGIDLVAMNVNDIVCLGARPLFFLDYIACCNLDLGVLSDVIKGIKKGLKESDCKLIGGETAEMPGMYKKGEYDLAGFCVGMADKKKIINGRNIKAGDLIIGLESSGLHSNGFSLVRKAFSRKEILKNSKILLKPTRIYVKPVLSLLSPHLGLLPYIKGIAHITGGAFYRKATKILPKGYCMVIDKNSWKVPAIFKKIQQKGAINDKEMYSVFNMGIGMILVVNKLKAKKIQQILSRYNLRNYIIGKIIKGKEKIKII